MNFSLNINYSRLTILFCFIIFSTSKDESVLGFTTLSLQQNENIQNGMISSLESSSQLKNEPEFGTDAVLSLIRKIEAKAKKRPEQKGEKNGPMKNNTTTNSNGKQTREQIAYKAYSAYVKGNNTQEKSRMKRETSYPSVNWKSPMTSNVKMEETETSSLHPKIIVKRSFRKISKRLIAKHRSIGTHGYLNRMYRDIPSDRIQLQVKEQRGSINGVHPIIMRRTRRATEAQMSQSGQVEGIGSNNMSTNSTIEGGSGSGNRRKGGGRRKGGKRKNGGGKRKQGTNVNGNDRMNSEGKMNAGADSEMGSGEINAGSKGGGAQRNGNNAEGGGNGNGGGGKRRGGGRKGGGNGKNCNRGEGSNGNAGAGVEGDKNREGGSGDVGNGGGGTRSGMNEENMGSGMPGKGMNNGMNGRPENGMGNTMNEGSIGNRNPREGMNGGEKNEGETKNEMNGGNMNGNQEKGMDTGMDEENRGSGMPGKGLSKMMPGMMGYEMPGMEAQKHYHGSLGGNFGDEKD